MRIQRLRGVCHIGVVACGCLALGVSGLLLVPTAAAACNTTAPGTTCSTPDSLATSTSSTLVQQKTGSLDSCSTSITKCFDATYVEDVYRDPSNVFCANCLDWLIQITDSTIPQSDTVDPIKDVTIGDFTGFQTDQGVDSNAPPSGSGLSTTGTATPNGPEAVSRDGSGAILGWEFNNPELMPGQTTVILDVMTNANTVVPGQISAQDSSSADNVGLAPALPEAPAVVALAAVGLGVAVAARRRLRSHRRG